MTTPKTSGLKAPSKIGKPSGLVQPKTGIQPPGASSAIAKSARAAGLSASVAEKYATNAVPIQNSPRTGSDESQTPVDDFIIGDRIFINGTKPGYVAFLGETQFAPGEWAGVVLDDPVGKNDGQVAGVRYFQCAAKHGVFSRITKLTRTPGQVPPASLPPPRDEGSSEPKAPDVTNGALSSSTPTTQQSSHLPQMRSTTPRLGLSSSRTKSASQQSLSKISPASSLSNLKDGPMMTSTPLAYGSVRSLGNLRIGDRVLVSGTKSGTLRYLGVTDFAKGDWAGVELDDAQGKNDGAVAGKRYFDCRPMYGLFAPLKKVAKISGGSIPAPSPQTRTLANTSLRLTRERSGSQDSISSLSSTASSVSRSRVRLGVTSLNSQAKPGQSRPGTLNISATTAALQKALKEKEEHIEQLLRERDLERAEVARAAAHIDEAEGKLINHQSEHGKYRDDAEDTIKRLKTIVVELEKDKKDALLKLEDEKRKVEDLQFQIEEESINKDDLESKTEEDLGRLNELFKKEKEKSIKFEQDLVAMKALCDELQQKLKDSDETQIQYLDQIEDLTHQQKLAEDKLKTFDSSRVEEGAKTSQVSLELAEKTARVAELEQMLADRNKDIKILERNMTELEENLMFANEKNLKMQNTVDELNNRITENDASSQNMNTEFQGVKSRLSDIQRQLDSSKQKNDQLNDDKQKLEQQLAELMQNSGDHSNQLSMLNEQVKEKARKIEDLQANLSNSTQRIGALNEQIEQINEENNREKGALILKHEELTKTLQGQLEDVQNEFRKSSEKSVKLSEDSEKEKVELSSRKDTEISELKKQLQMSTEQLEKQEVQTQAHKQFLEQLNLEKDAIKYEKEKNEKLLKRYEAEKETLNQEFIQMKVQMTKQQTEWDGMVKEKDQLTEELDNIKYENQKMIKMKEEFQKQKSDISTEKNDILKEKNSLEAQLKETISSVETRDKEIGELKKHIDKLNADMTSQSETLMQKSQEASEVVDLQKQMHEMKGTMELLQTSLKDTQADRDRMRIELQNSDLIKEDRKRLETQVQQLKKQMEDTKLSHSQEMDSVQTDRSALQERIESTLKTLQQREQDILLHKEQITNLQNQNATLVTVQSQAEKLETEKKDLTDYTKVLEKQIQESKQNANVLSNNNVGDPAVAKVVEEKNEALQQIEFLNSVIVESQKKNEELKIRLEAMESGVQNSNSITAMDVGSPAQRAPPPPRLFCDICDVFDLHDTEDCPQQAMSDSPPPSHHHGDRKQLRPYCDICEVFGHWTEDCDDEQTF